jgi:hypothetical protein
MPNLYYYGIFFIILQPGASNTQVQETTCKFRPRNVQKMILPRQNIPGALSQLPWLADSGEH